MKLDFSKDALNRLFANILVVLVGISFYFALLHLETIRDFMAAVLGILRPFVYGFVIAFLLNNPVKYFDRVMRTFVKKEKMRRALSVLLAMVLFGLLIGLLIAFLVPQLIDSTVTLVRNIQEFAMNLDQTVEDWFAVLNQYYHIDPDIYKKLLDAWEQILAMGSSLLVTVFQRLLGLTGQITSGVIDFFVALIISVYLLMSREQFFAQTRKVLYALFHKKTVENLLYVGQLTSSTFNGFINGKLIDSLIIGILAFICLTIMKMPYVLLISVIIGVTNIVPFFGPFVGAIPSAFIIFIVDPIQALWFLVFILVLQQIDGNIIGPKILGGTTGLPAIWVMFAILVGGGMAGFVGMIVGVPAVAVIYTLFKAYIKQRLEHKSLPSNTEAYAESGCNPYQKKRITEIVQEQQAGEKEHDAESAKTDS